MDYNKLRTFVTVANVKSISQAARLLYRTQSAITQQMRGLEADLQLVLYERKGKKIYLTPEGERLSGLARDHLSQIDDGVLLMKGANQLIEGVIRVGLQKDYATEYPFGERLAAFQKKFPKIKLEVSYGTSPVLEEGLLNNQLDIGFLIVFKAPQFFDRQEVASADHILVASSEYLKDKGPFDSLKGLLSGEFLDFTSDCLCLRAWVAENYPRSAAAFKKVRPIMVVPNHFEMKEMVMSGLGIAPLPKYLVKAEISNGKLIQLFRKSRALSAGLDIAIRKKRTRKLYEEKFLEFMRGFPVVGA